MDVMFPASPWQDAPGICAILAALPEARFVGGCVRDTLAGEAVNDVDLATPLAPEAVVARLEAAGLKAVPTGLAHGTVTAIAHGQAVEVTTLRRDVSTDGRRATVAYTDDWREDAARRDFTINALYAEPQSGMVHDYFGGLADLAEGKIRFIGDPLQRIAEDHLRILRFFRFSARFAKAGFDPDGLAACAVRANDLMALSRERIAMELLALLALPAPAPTVEAMIGHGIFRPVLPEVISAAPLARLVTREATFGVAGDPVRRLASLLPSDPALAEAVGARLKLSKAQRKRLDAAAGFADTNGDARVLAYWIGVESAMDRLLLGEGDPTPLTLWTPPALPLSGGAIVARGVQAGPDVARILKQVERRWVEEGFPDPARVNAMLDDALERRA